ncbi:unnamed protein product [Rangifer tarandus platyrhynchus]|uniref:Uncharacterized protein n=1 Tax=Rangifer tarandus platyrhynchus TaxID=3082113 RepID=A0AC59Z9G9_RANTA
MAVVQTEAGLAPADQAELRRAVALGTRPLTDEQLAQGLWCGNPAFDSPGEGAVLLGREDKAGLLEYPYNVADTSSKASNWRKSKAEAPVRFVV